MQISSFWKDFFTNFKSLALKTEVKNKDLEILDMIHLIYELQTGTQSQDSYTQYINCMDSS